MCVCVCRRCGVATSTRARRCRLRVRYLTLCRLRFSATRNVPLTDICLSVLSLDTHTEVRTILTVFFFINNFYPFGTEKACNPTYFTVNLNKQKIIIIIPPPRQPYPTYSLPLLLSSSSLFPRRYLGPFRRVLRPRSFRSGALSLLLSPRARRIAVRLVRTRTSDDRVVSLFRCALCVCAMSGCDVRSHSAGLCGPSFRF